MDFQDVTHWQNNKLDRTQSSRMGWSDVSICLTGPVVEDLKAHFSQRWNFIFVGKYSSKDESGRYQAIHYDPTPVGIINEGQAQIQTDMQSGDQFQQHQYRDVDSPEGGERGFEQEGERGFGDGGRFGEYGEHLRERVEGEFERTVGERFGGHHHHGGHHGPGGGAGPRGGVACQITRSCTKWSHGVALEVSFSPTANSFDGVLIAYSTQSQTHISKSSRTVSTLSTSKISSSSPQVATSKSQSRT